MWIFEEFCTCWFLSVQPPLFTEIRSRPQSRSEDTIKNLRNRPNIIFPIQEIVAVCIAMHLPPAISMEYIRISPSKFQTTVEMKLYEYALIQWYMRPVAEVNRLLVEAEVQPLTNLVDGFDKNGWKVANG